MERGREQDKRQIVQVQEWCELTVVGHAVARANHENLTFPFLLQQAITRSVLDFSKNKVGRDQLCVCFKRPAFDQQQVSSNVVEKCFEITAIGVHADVLADERHFGPQQKVGLPQSGGHCSGLMRLDGANFSVCILCA